MFELKLDAVSTTTLTILLLLFGYFIKRRISFLEKFCIPTAVIGGFTMSLLILALHQSAVGVVSFDTSLQTPLMIAFFTTIGIGGSLKLLRSGGSALLAYLVICWGIGIFQDIFGIFATNVFGLDQMFGIMAGGISLEGGHGAAAAFGPVAEKMGHAGSTTVAISSATYGLIAGGLLGGPVAKWLIKRHQVKIESEKTNIIMPEVHIREEDVSVTSHSLIASLGLILVLMVLGSAISSFFEKTWHFVLPGYVGAMLAAIIFRNLNDWLKICRLNRNSIDAISDVSLGIFLTMAMMSLKIWELRGIEFSLFAVLLLQTIAMVLIAVFIAFPLLGKNYDAAVMCAGMMGHGLGATPNAVANMGAVNEHYKVTSYKALLIVPLCGAVLIDIVAIPFHTWIINFLH
jgi:ESS family glutamate:Na+ symporter